MSMGGVTVPHLVMKLGYIYLSLNGDYTKVRPGSW